MKVLVSLSLPLLLGILSEVVVCSVELQPQGKELFCPTEPISRTLICNVSGTTLTWIINTKTGSPITRIFNWLAGILFNPFNTNGIEGSVISATDSSVSSQLVIPNDRDLLPLTVKCTTGDQDTSITYSLMATEFPDPPTNVNVSKAIGISDNYTISWQTPATSSENKPVEEYNISITSISSSISVPSSPTQSIITTDTSISVQLNQSTNYTVSLRSSNCAGLSAEATYEISPQALGGDSTMYTIITTSTSDITMPVMSSDSTGKTPASGSTQSLQTSVFSMPITSDSNLESSSPLLISGMLLAIIVAVIVGVIILLVVFIIIIIGIIICYRKKYLKAVTKETAVSISEDQVHAEGGGPGGSSNDNSLKRSPEKSTTTTENIQLKSPASTHTVTNTTHLNFIGGLKTTHEGNPLPPGDEQLDPFYENPEEALEGNMVITAENVAYEEVKIDADSYSDYEN